MPGKEVGPRITLKEALTNPPLKLSEVGFIITGIVLPQIVAGGVIELLNRIGTGSSKAEILVSLGGIMGSFVLGAVAVVDTARERDWGRKPKIEPKKSSTIVREVNVRPGRDKKIESRRIKDARTSSPEIEGSTFSPEELFVLARFLKAEDTQNFLRENKSNLTPEKNEKINEIIRDIEKEWQEKGKKQPKGNELESIIYSLVEKLQVFTDTNRRKFFDRNPDPWSATLFGIINGFSPGGLKALINDLSKHC